MMTNDARRTREIKSRMVVAKAAFNKKTVFTSKLKLVKCYIGSPGFYSAETWALRKIDQVYMEGFEMWYWRRMPGFYSAETWALRKIDKLYLEGFEFPEKDGEDQLDRSR
jgi:hypothetical protein